MHVSQHTIWINDISCSHCNSTGLIIWILDKSSIWSANSMGWISKEWNIHLTKTTYLSVFQSPLFVNKDRVYWSTNNLAITFCKIFCVVWELNNLSWTNESEITWIEEKYNPFTIELFQWDLLEFLIPVCHSFEFWCWFSYSSFMIIMVASSCTHALWMILQVFVSWALVRCELFWTVSWGWIISTLLSYILRWTFVIVELNCLRRSVWEIGFQSCCSWNLGS